MIYNYDNPIPAVSTRLRDIILTRSCILSMMSFLSDNCLCNDTSLEDEPLLQLCIHVIRNKNSETVKTTKSFYNIHNSHISFRYVYYLTLSLPRSY